MLDVLKPLGDKAVIESELESFGIRLNKKPPAITVRKKDKGGIAITNTVPLTNIDHDEIKAVLSEYRRYHFGRELVLALHEWVKQHARTSGESGVVNVRLHSQLYVKPFYAKYGYQPEVIRPNATPVSHKAHTRHHSRATSLTRTPSSRKRTSLSVRRLTERPLTRASCCPLWSRRRKRKRLRWTSS